MLLACIEEMRPWPLTPRRFQAHIPAWEKQASLCPAPGSLQPTDVLAAGGSSSGWLVPAGGTMSCLAATPLQLAECLPCSSLKGLQNAITLTW